MRYSIELGKIVEGAFQHDLGKVANYTEQLISKLKDDGENRAADKFRRLLDNYSKKSMLPMELGKFNNIPVDVESRMSLATVIYPTDNQIEVVLSKNNFEKLQSFILGYKNADRLNSLGIGLSNTLLLYGPPGCGKTKCAFLIAKELNLPLIIANLDSLISSYLGTTAKNIRSLFDYIQKMPCVLFLDEFDAVAKARDDSNELGELKRVVNSLLQNIDAMSNTSLLIAATNHESLLDTAVWRRFDYKLEIERPDTEAVNKLLELFISDNLVLTEREKSEMAFAFGGLSGADIEIIVKQALRNAVIFGHEFSKFAIYEEFFNFRGFFCDGGENQREVLKKRAKFLRSCNEKVFSYAIIANILKISKTMVATLLTEESD